MAKRELGKVGSVHRSTERGINVIVDVKFPGTGQGLVSPSLDEATLVDYERELCALFGVRRLHDIVGQECFALRPREGFGEFIVGLECEGRRFTLAGFRRKHWPDKAPGPDEAFLSALDPDYTDWETAPL